MEITREIQAVRIQKGRRQSLTETVVREETLCLYVNGRLLVRLQSSPSHLEELALGFLFSEGIIHGIEDLLEIKQGGAPTTLFVRVRGEAPDEVALAGAVRTSGCGGGVLLSEEARRIKPIVSELKVGAEEIIAVAREFEASSVVFRRTGGVHACALARGGRILLHREDIGRHNALDKVLGAALKEKIDLSASITYISGRISSEMVLKGARARVSMIVSRTAPTSTAVDLAGELGVCLVGFVRGGRMNVYTQPDRVL